MVPGPVFRAKPDGTRSRMLHGSATFDVSLVWYPPGKRQAMHEHCTPQVSLLLAGSYGEIFEACDVEARSGSFGAKPAGARHEVAYGRDGALVLSIGFPGEYPAASFSRLPFGLPQRRLIALLGAQTGDGEELAEDLLASLAPEPVVAASRARAMPGWIEEVIERLVHDAETPIASLAVQAGVHRVHLSRLVRQRTGISPSELRLRGKCTRAICAMVQGNETPAEAAAAAGFADQPHLTRTCRAFAGLTPGRISRLLAA